MSSTDCDSSNAAASRDRSLRLAVATSLVSKVGTIVLRLVSIPVAVHLLGMEMFGVYTAITMAVGMIDMLHIGIGPALTKALAKAVARGEKETEKTIFATSILMSVGLTLLAAAVAITLLFSVPIPQLFGKEFASVQTETFRAALLGLLIIQMEMVCIPFEMARDGYQETRFTNIWGAAGNLLGALMLLSGIWFFPTIEFLLIAVNGSIALSKLGNAIHLLSTRRYLFPRFSLFRKKLVSPLAKDGIRFSVTYIMAAAVEYNLMAFLIGHKVNPESVGVWNVMVTIHFSLTGLVGMITKPYWPALMDAFERNDKRWITRSSNRLKLGGLGFSLLAALGLIIAGPWVIQLWAGKEIYTAPPVRFRPDHWAMLTFSTYFIAHIWRHVNQTLALGVGLITPVTKAVVAEGLLVITTASLVLFNNGSITEIYLVITLSILAVSGWLFPLYFRRGQSLPDPGSNLPLNKPHLWLRERLRNLRAPVLESGASRLSPDAEKKETSHVASNG